MSDIIITDMKHKNTLKKSYQKPLIKFLRMLNARNN